MLLAGPLLLAAMLPATSPEVVREVTYVGAYIGGHRPIPLYDRGYLAFLDYPNHLALFAPGGKLAYRIDIPSPVSGSMSAIGFAVDERGNAVVGIGYLDSGGRRGGMALLSPTGELVRFVPTGRFMPSHFRYAADGSLWATGWQRDSVDSETEDREDYAIARKYSAEGKELAAILPRSLFAKRLPPASGCRGCQTLFAAKDRMGTTIQPSDAGRPSEWVEWDLSGRILGRWKVGDIDSAGLAFTSSNKLLRKQYQLECFDRKAGTWLPVDEGIEDPPPADSPGLLLGADGEDLAFARTGGGMTRLVWIRFRD